MTTRTTMPTETGIAPVFSPFEGGTSTQRKSWINRSGKLVGAALAAGMALGLAGTASAAIILYQENFDGTGSLNGAIPSFVNYGEHGIPSENVTWSASGFQQDGSVGSGGDGGALLPFIPQNGWIYTLEVTLQTTTTTDWISAGFRDDTSTTSGSNARATTGGLAYFATRAAAGSDNQWYRGDGEGDNPLSTNLDDTNGATYRIVMDMMDGVDSAGLTFYRKTDGAFVEVASSPGLEDFTSMRQLHLSVNGNPGHTYDSLTLTAIPEPGSLALLAAGTGLILLRRRRSY